MSDEWWGNAVREGRAEHVEALKNALDELGVKPHATSQIMRAEDEIKALRASAEMADAEMAELRRDIHAYVETARQVAEALRVAITGEHETMSAAFDATSMLVTEPWTCECGAKAKAVTQDAHEAEIEHALTCWIAKATAALAAFEGVAR